MNRDETKHTHTPGNIDKVGASVWWEGDPAWLPTCWPSPSLWQTNKTRAGVKHSGWRGCPCLGWRSSNPLLFIKTVPVKSSCMISLYVAVFSLQTQPLSCQTPHQLVVNVWTVIYLLKSVVGCLLEIISRYRHLCSGGITRGQLWFVSRKLWLTGDWAGLQQERGGERILKSRCK